MTISYCLDYILLNTSVNLIMISEQYLQIMTLLATIQAAIGSLIFGFAQYYIGKSHSKSNEINPKPYLITAFCFAIAGILLICGGAAFCYGIVLAEDWKSLMSVAGWVFWLPPLAIFSLIVGLILIWRN